MKQVVINNLPDLPVPLTNPAATSLGNIIYIAGGETVSEVSRSFYSLDLNNTAAGWQLLPDLPQAVSNAVMVVQASAGTDKIYLLGG